MEAFNPGKVKTEVLNRADRVGRVEHLIVMMLDQLFHLIQVEEVLMLNSRTE